MKKLIYLIMSMALIFTSCDPMDDIHSEIDSQEKNVVGDAVYTLVDADYSALKLTYGNFSSVDEVKTLIPSFLDKKYPVWGNGSSVLVGFKLYVGNAPGLTDYTYADDYRLANSDYPGASDNAVGFYPNENPKDFLGDILSAKIANPTEGDNVLVKYKQYVGEPVVGISNYFDADFMSEGTLLNFETVNVLGDQVWVETPTYGAKMTGYAGARYANEDWLISPQIDLTSQSNVSFQVNQALNYASGRLDLLKILVSSNYSSANGPAAATWDEISLTTKPAGTNWTFVLSEDYDFSAYEGKKVHIAFKYESTTSVASTWEIGRVLLKTPGVEGETINKEVFYTYKNGSWVEAQGVYFLSDADFDSMGEGAGQPGQYNNFSSSVSPDNYLPTFLKIKFPYAQDGTELFVIYDYYSSSSGAQVRGNLYTYTAGEWMGHKSVIDSTLQFGHDGSTWVPDNTIKYTLTNADYALVGNGRYNNFDVRAGKAEEAESVRLEKINTILLNNFPGMAEGQKFTVSYAIYNGAAGVWEMKVILSGGAYVLQ